MTTPNGSPITLPPLPEPDYTEDRLRWWNAASMRTNYLAGYRACQADRERLAVAAPVAWQDVQAERQRQISAEGWVPEHDDEHWEGDLSLAGAVYAVTKGPRKDVPPAWPWEAEAFKPRDWRKNLVKAGALILAEIERLDRSASKNCVDPMCACRGGPCAECPEGRLIALAAPAPVAVASEPVAEVWEVSSNVVSVLCATKERAEKFVSGFAGSVAAGMRISQRQVWGFVATHAPTAEASASSVAEPSGEAIRKLLAEVLLFFHDCSEPIRCIDRVVDLEHRIGDFIAAHPTTPKAAPEAVPVDEAVAVTWPVMPPSMNQSPILFEDGYAEGWAKCISMCKAAFATAPQAMPVPLTEGPTEQAQAHAAAFMRGLDAGWASATANAEALYETRSDWVAYVNNDGFLIERDGVALAEGCKLYLHPKLKAEVAHAAVKGEQ